MQAAALRARGWSISAIARHLGRDRKTVRDYLSGKRVPGERQRPQPDPFDVIAGYVAQRLADDAHVWATPYTTKWSPWVTRSATRASPGRCDSDGCARTARRAPA